MFASITEYLGMWTYVLFGIAGVTSLGLVCQWVSDRRKEKPDLLEDGLLYGGGISLLFFFAFCFGFFDYLGPGDNEFTPAFGALMLGVLLLLLLVCLACFIFCSYLGHRRRIRESRPQVQAAPVRREDAPFF